MKKTITTTLAMLSAALLVSPQAALAQGAVTQWHANAQTLVAAFTGRGNAAQAYTRALIQVAVYDATVAIRGLPKRSQTASRAIQVVDRGRSSGAHLDRCDVRGAKIHPRPTRREDRWALACVTRIARVGLYAARAADKRLGREAWKLPFGNDR